MNEDKKQDRDFFNVGSTKKDDANTLLSQIIYFKNNNNEITPHDLVALDIIIKQLNQRRANFPRKVLRGMANKFQTIKNTYQR